MRPGPTVNQVCSMVQPRVGSGCGSEFFFALTVLALFDVDAPPSTIVAMQRTLAVGFLQASAGQRADLSFSGKEVVTAAEVEAWPFPWESLRWLFRASGAADLESEP